MSETGREAALRAAAGAPAAHVAVWEACSACTGDYEDPDRTAWSAEEQAPAVDDEEEPEAREDEFPVPEAHQE